jgi:ABC-type oligopeptide transport system ATPase subunit
VENSDTPLLSIRGLTKSFGTKPGLFARSGHVVHALDDVSLDIPRGTTVGIVGESGSGKSTLGRCILRLIDPDRGTVTWNEPLGSAVLQPANGPTAETDRRGLVHRATDVTALAGEDLRAFRRRMQVIFQDPYNSLNPARPVWQVVGEGLMIAGAERRSRPATEQEGSGPSPPRSWTAAPFSRDRREIRERAAAMLASVGLTRDHLDRFPHEFSGGQRQRLAIARALIVEPEFLVCDEVTSALDTRTQAQVLELLRELQARTGVTVLFISHDLHTVAAMSREVVVMRAGRIVERGAPDQLFTSPTEAYTRELVAAVPNPDPRKRTFRRAAAGQP